jgi:hypothetical protein
MIKTLKICTRDYNVEYKDLSAWGYNYFHKKLIQVSKHADKHQKATILFHEALHGICAEYGLALDNEEMTVRLLETAIVKFFQDNPKFTKEFLESTK